MEERIFKCHRKYGGLLVKVEDTDKFDTYTHSPADTGTVIRCRDCMYSAEGATKCEHFMVSYWAVDTGNDERVSADVFPDGYCAWGRK